MISTRFTLPVALLAAAALVPTTLHAYLKLQVTDGRSLQAVPLRLEDRVGFPTRRAADWVDRRFAGTDWIERQYGEVTLFAVRSYDAKRLYHHPELAITRGLDLRDGGTFRPGARPDLPVFSLRPASAGSPARVYYALLYGDNFVEDALRFQVQTSFELLVQGRRPMTLFYVTDANGGRAATPDDAMGVKLLVDAVTQFLAQPGTR